MTVAELEAGIAARTLHGCGTVSEPTLRFLVARLMEKRAAPRADLASSRTSGYKRAASAALRELGLLDREELVRAISGLRPGAGRERLLFLADLRVDLEDLLRARSLMDAGMRYRAALRALALDAPLPTCLRDRTRVVFRYVLDLGPRRLALIEALAKRVGESATKVSIELPRVPLDRFLDAALERLHAMESEGLPVSVVRREAAPATAAALVAAGARGAEARAVIEEARVSMTRGPVTIALAETAGEGGTGAIRALEREARVRGLAIHTRRGEALAATEIGRLLLLVHELLSDDIPREGLIRAMASGAASRIDRRVPWERVARMLRHTGVTKDRPAGALALALDEMARRMERSQERSRFKPDDVREAARQVAELVAVLRTLDGEHSAVEWARLHGDLLDSVGAVRTVAAPLPAVLGTSRDGSGGASPRIRMMDDHAVGREARALREIVAILESLPELVAGDLSALPRKNIAELLRDVLEERHLRTLGARQPRIRIVSLRELPGLHAGRLLIPGAVEGGLPRSLTPDPLISDPIRNRINELLDRPLLQIREDPEDEAPPGHVAPLAWEQELLLSVVISESRDGALLFRHKSGEDGRIVPESPLLEDLRSVGLLAGVERELPNEPLGSASTEQRELARAVSSGRGEGSDTRTDDLRFRLAMEAARFRFFSERSLQADRFSGEAPVSRALGLHPTDRVLGVASVESYVRCPFRYFGTRVLRIEEAEEGEPELDAASTGTYLHRLAEEVYRRLRSDRLLPLDPSDLDAVRTLVDAVEKQLDASWRECRDVGHPRVWSCTRADARRRMKSVLERDAEELGSEGYEPVEIEAEFGFEGSDWAPLVIEHPEGDVLLRGRIDRVDRRRDGEGVSLLVVDYKSGKADSHNKKLTPKYLLHPHLQLPAYAAAAAANSPPGSSIDGLFRAFGGGKTVRLSRHLDPEAPIDLGSVVRPVAGGMRRGSFPIRSLDCDHCSLRAVCRVVELSLEDAP